MILKGSQRSGAKQLALHLLNERDNDHVTVHEVRGFVANDLLGALTEAHAIAKGTKCKQFLFSLSLNPPKEVIAGEEDFRKAADRAEQKLGLTNQPRVLVFHEKEGRRHAHVVWSRIDPATMTAINLSFFKEELTSLSRDLYLEHDWTLPDGLRRDGGKSPLNFSLAEWQQAKRLKLDPREIKQSFIEAWQRSDDAKSFATALLDRGYFLARGDRRGVVTLNIHGEVFAIPRWTGLRTKEVRARIGDSESLPSVHETRERIKGLVTDKLHHFMNEADQHHAAQQRPLTDERAAMIRRHREERATLTQDQATRWQEEQQVRANRFRKGLRGLWDRLTGTTAAIRKQNEQERWEHLTRDREERDGLVVTQMKERQALQERIVALRRKHTQDRRIQTREVADYLREMERRKDQDTKEREHAKERTPNHPRPHRRRSGNPYDRGFSP
ncbi:relaxase/mobilization nuclease domain-containing protein [Rhodospirillum sp. A1_3_36]|uniref:relaxase/mobilization nuclease domain-containing protein n=1 Tax=Rhodospirillum sp. A1_3_36 TaxID=3391666 RepID=UPI0039A49E90